jgi:hypothetical protein
MTNILLIINIIVTIINITATSYWIYRRYFKKINKKFDYIISDGTAIPKKEIHIGGK